MATSDRDIIRIVVADDLPALRRGLGALFKARKGMRLLGATENAAETLALIARRKPDVLVLDAALQGARGVGLVRALRAKHPKLGVVVYGLEDEDKLAAAALKAGANGFVSKRGPEEELLRAVQAAAQGRRYLSPALAERIVREMEVPEEAPPHQALSERELDVLCFLAEGKRPSEIAELLGLSAKTIHTHRARIFEKLELRTTVDLVRYAAEHRLVAWAPPEAAQARRD